MIIKSHTQLSDEDFENSFSTKRLKPHLFSHEAHIRLAYIHIKKYGAAKAQENMCQQIKDFADSLGATDKFNKTVTIASIKLLAHFMNRSTTSDFSEFIEENPAILNDFKGIISKHYGFNVFADRNAKNEFIEPDLAPLPGEL